RRRIIRSDTIVACESDFITAASRRAVDCRDGWNLQSCQPVKDPLPVSDERPHIAALRLSQQRLQVGPGYKNRFLSRRDDQSAQRGIISNDIKMCIQLVERRCVEDVRARLRAIKSQQANVILADLAADHWTCGNCRHHLILERFPQMPSGENERRVRRATKLKELQR